MADEEGLEGIMQNAKKLQTKMQDLQDEMAHTEITGESGAGLVKVTMTGRHDVTRVEIDPSLLQEAMQEVAMQKDAPEDSMQEKKALLEDLIGGAVNDAVRRAERTHSERMSELTSDLPMPPGMKFPFS